MEDDFRISWDDRYRFYKGRYCKDYSSESKMLQELINEKYLFIKLRKEVLNLINNDCSDDVIYEWCLKHNYQNCKDRTDENIHNFIYYFKRTLKEGQFRDFSSGMLLGRDSCDVPIQVLEEKLVLIEQIEFNKFQREKYIKEQESFKKYDSSLFKSELSFKIFKLFVDRYVVDCYKDFSFIYHTMLSEDYIYKMKQSHFVDWLLTNNFISSSQREISRWEEGLSKKYGSFERLDFYQKVKEELGV